MFCSLFFLSLVGRRDEDKLIQLGSGRYKSSGYRYEGGCGEVTSSPPGFGLPRLTGSIVLPYYKTFQLPFNVVIYYVKPLGLCNKLWLLF